PWNCSATDGRSRVSRGSAEVHTEQWHPIVGTPALVPDPRTVNLIAPLPGSIRSSWPGRIVARSGIATPSLNFQSGAVPPEIDCLSFSHGAWPAYQWCAG